MKLLVPSYFYATDPAWDALIAGAVSCQIDCVVNPRNGAGDFVNEDYRKLCIRLRKAGVGIAGYVSTRWGERPADEVLAEIGDYNHWYGVRNTFLDEAATSSDEMFEYYKKLYEASLGLVVLNHGTIPDEAYLGCGDILVIFEASYATHSITKFPGWIKRHPANRFAQIIHSAPDWPCAKRSLAKSSETSGFVYVTDDTGDNPYDRLPSYWQKELKATAVW